MIVALGLPLKVTTLILCCIFSMLFNDFMARGPISLPTPPIVPLTEFSHADAVTSVHPLPESYLISSLCVYLCSWMRIISMLCCMADAVSSGSCPILFKVLRLKVNICIVCLHISNFWLNSESDFSNIEARAPTSAGRALFLPALSFDKWFECVSWLFFYGCFYSHP